MIVVLFQDQATAFKNDCIRGKKVEDISKLKSGLSMLQPWKGCFASPKDIACAGTQFLTEGNFCDSN
ncbi:hypothetical protein X798_03073 [Onchocerca flexuosa]|uniref:Uncharacterized protein n=1 Tax=Onchocerca flexuosa TaxID=387005 RepID=A0A238BXF9_9BILA|nr:hypothetical protein X798_03073 [Onchocerca flexuosa]